MTQPDLKERSERLAKRLKAAHATLHLYADPNNWHTPVNATTPCLFDASFRGFDPAQEYFGDDFETASEEDF